MTGLRFKGLVRVAETVRRELGQPITPGRLEQLRRDVALVLSKIDRIVVEAGARMDALPAPSRRAYQYLRSLNFERAIVSDRPCEDRYAQSSLRFSRLGSFLKGVLGRLAVAADQSGPDNLYRSVSELSQNIERQIEESYIKPEHLKPESRQLRAWFGYFSRRDNFDAYIAALRTSRPVFEQAMRASARCSLPAVVHFRPMKGIYRVQAFRNCTLVGLPTPMICFDGETFGALAGFLFCRAGSKQTVLEAMLGKDYQGIQAELEAMGGIVENAAGAFHDLAASFERVNAAYFGGRMPQPRLAWSSLFSNRKFGLYAAVRDTVMVSNLLDRPDVPQLVVDFLVYHELLHKKHGIYWRSGRRAVHTPQFLEEERQFREYSQAKAVLDSIARSR